MTIHSFTADTLHSGRTIGDAVSSILEGFSARLAAWPPFRPDSRRNAGGLRLSSSTCLCLTIISGSN